MSALEQKKQRIAERIKEDPYEGHQMLRTLVNRQVKNKQFDTAVELLYSGASTLFDMNETASAGDLAQYIMDTYTKAGFETTPAHKARAIEVLAMFPKEESTRKQYVHDLIAWSKKSTPSGDEDVQDAVANAFVKWEEPEKAESHFVLGNSQSPLSYGHMLYQWYTGAETKTDAGVFAGRAVINYLLAENLNGAKTALSEFSKLLSEKGQETMQKASIDDVSVSVFPNHPLVNFFWLLLVAASREAQPSFLNLKETYAEQLKAMPGWQEASEKIGEKYFHIKPAFSQGNLLSGLMNSFFGLNTSAPAGLE
ncbi:ER membrane insertion protein [Schizosaccharomyces japonicus yFS275]|uniref:ER membrane insertion protein n=1 Tax=Schizosaccharomyces japonicus (strain yFS275 / FY16936) TaxID=402676 RepID=B6K596_SCHJY|nr:ER membrane insertion protein [Schizosaccharomyces japonicus yFS275]EEB08700.1 ER membrane insertion protein [Schizosaccharomyces japonicus yFS275]